MLSFYMSESTNAMHGCICCANTTMNLIHDCMRTAAFPHCATYQQLHCWRFIETCEVPLLTKDLTILFPLFLLLALLPVFLVLLSLSLSLLLGLVKILLALSPDLLLGFLSIST